MKKVSIFIFVFFILIVNAQDRLITKAPAAEIPNFLAGNFTDDYGIRYTISDTLWVQHPRTKFHIIRWNTKEQYFVARNGAANPGDKNLYTRIDYMPFEAMEPWKWGYCLTAYNALNDSIAEATAAADRKNPKKGCNGYPFSRMKRTE